MILQKHSLDCYLGARPPLPLPPSNKCTGGGREGAGTAEVEVEAAVVFPDDVLVRSAVQFSEGLEGLEGGEAGKTVREGVEESALLGAGDVASTFVLAEIMDDALAAHRCEECALCIAP
ncbi:hypothetical protein PsYK624_164630 [Phanerochaete sordida]|uniref:Uncharacterized protein n=1 Tax=Phanerochaete sordida TaxID=48140 RepID=A0A9P3LLW6_9APHY|nr:hypothetical protein PsYK624_164630 [Phanerochaete sordida]